MKRIKAGISLIIIIIFLFKKNLLIPYLTEFIPFYFNAVIIFFKSEIEQKVIREIITFVIIALIVLIFSKIPKKSMTKKIKQLIELFQQFF